MNPLLIIAIPLSLVIVGMVLNSICLSFDQPSSSQEQDPTKGLAAERDRTVYYLTRREPGRSSVRIEWGSLLGCSCYPLSVPSSGSISIL